MRKLANRNEKQNTNNNINKENVCMHQLAQQ